MEFQSSVLIYQYRNFKTDNVMEEQEEYMDERIDPYMLFNLDY